MKTLNLNELLADLEKTAGIEKTATATKPNVSAELSGILEKKASEDITGAALAAGEALAKELLTKLAAENAIQKGNDEMVTFDSQKVVDNKGAPGTDTKPEPGLEGALVGTVEEGIKRGAKSDDVVDDELDKKAEEQTNMENSKMAKNIMQKIAQIVGETLTTPAVAANTIAATAPNLIQSSNADITKFDDGKVKALPAADGTLNNILEAIVARAEAQGATSDNLVDGDLPPSGASGDKEVHSPAVSATGVTNGEEVEKAAAVSALVEAGCDFDSAIAMVKEAEQLIRNDEDQQEKIAAVNELCAYGYDFDTAIELVKQAEEDLAKEATILAPREQEKIAAFDALVEAGIDFDQAAAMVKQAELDVYGDK